MVNATLSYTSQLDVGVVAATQWPCLGEQISKVSMEVTTPRTTTSHWEELCLTERQAAVENGKAISEHGRLIIAPPT